MRSENRISEMSSQKLYLNYLEIDNYYLLQNTCCGLQYTLVVDAASNQNIFETRLLPENFSVFWLSAFGYQNYSLHLWEKAEVTTCQIWRIRQLVELCDVFFYQKRERMVTGSCFRAMLSFQSKFEELFMGSIVSHNFIRTS